MTTRAEMAEQAKLLLDNVLLQLDRLSKADIDHARELLNSSIERLAAAPPDVPDLREAAIFALYQLEKARIWGGTEWVYNPLHPLFYVPARDRLDAALHPKALTTPSETP